MDYVKIQVADGNRQLDCSTESGCKSVIRIGDMVRVLVNHPYYEEVTGMLSDIWNNRLYVLSVGKESRVTTHIHLDDIEHICIV